MKYAVISVVILLVILALCLTASALSTRYLTEMEQLLSQAGVEDIADAQKVSGLWQEHKGFFYSILNHAETDELSCRMQSLVQYAKEGEDGEYYALRAEILESLRHIQEMDRPIYYNIL